MNRINKERLNLQVSFSYSRKTPLACCLGSKKCLPLFQKHTCLTASLLTEATEAVPMHGVSLNLACPISGPTPAFSNAGAKA